MKPVRWLAVSVACSPLILIAPVILALSGTAAASCARPAGSAEIDAIAQKVQQILAGQSGTTAVPGLDNPAEQLPNAKIIVATGDALMIPARGQVVALAAALQESGLRNLAHGDRDSLGLFQQRPSQGWGTPEQIQDPVFASTSFYRRLISLTGWENLRIGQAAQAVQQSGYPDAYDKWVPLATALQQAIAQASAPTTPPPSPTAPSTDPASPTLPPPGSTANPAPSAQAPSTTIVRAGLAGCTSDPGGDGSGFGEIPAGALPDGYTIPADAPEQVRTAIRWALGQLGTPYQWGGTCLDARGPDPMGRCDCSSLTQRSYAAAGITLTRTTYTQVTEGTAVTVDQLKPGDLVFTRPGSQGPEHVGMVIGSGLIVNAPKTGDVVRIATIADWKHEIIAARRIVP